MTPVCSRKPSGFAGLRGKALPRCPPDPPGSRSEQFGRCFCRIRLCRTAGARHGYARHRNRLLRHHPICRSARWRCRLPTTSRAVGEQDVLIARQVFEADVNEILHRRRAPWRADRHFRNRGGSSSPAFSRTPMVASGSHGSVVAAPRFTIRPLASRATAQAERASPEWAKPGARLPQAPERQ